jgi:molybdopterin-binding protein
MKISARNVFDGEVKNIEVGAIMANVKIEVTSPEIITAIITKESIEKLGLKEGDKVSAIIKSTEVMVAKD